MPRKLQQYSIKEKNTQNIEETHNFQNCQVIMRSFNEEVAPVHISKMISEMQEGGRDRIIFGTASEGNYAAFA